MQAGRLGSMALAPRCRNGQGIVDRWVAAGTDAQGVQGRGQESKGLPMSITQSAWVLVVIKY